MSTKNTSGPIELTRGECLAIALVLQTREKRGAVEFEAALESAEKKLAPFADAAFEAAFSALTGDHHG